MTSFKIKKGLEANLPIIKEEGTMYFCTDTGNLYIDCQEDDEIIRKLVDSSKFDEINDEFGSVRFEISELSSEVADIDSKLDNKSDITHNHNDLYLQKNNPVGTGSFSLNRMADTDIGEDSFAEGDRNTASGAASHAEGKSTVASSTASHAEGFLTKAEGNYSHAEGTQTSAYGENSHTEGQSTAARGDNSHVQGKYNIVNSDSTLAHIVGNGTAHNARSNAHTLDWGGNAWFSGDVYVGSTSGTNKDDGSKKLATENYVNNITNYYGVCETAASTAAKTVQIDGFELKTGAMVLIKFKYSNSASNPTLNVNETGDIPLKRYGTTSIGTDSNTNSWYTGAVQLFVYDGTNWIRDYWNNPTHSNAKMAGIGYGTCSTAEATTTKTVSMSSYEIKVGGIVSIKFTYNVPYNTKLNINGKGAFSIYYQGKTIASNIIKAGDIATFITQQTNSNIYVYHLISIDRQISGAATTITDSDLTANSVLISNSSGKVAVSSTTSTELEYLSGVTSSIQSQLDDKAVIQMITWGDDD